MRAPEVNRPEKGTGSLTARGERTRRRLLEAAEDVFSKASYDEAAIVQITARAGVATGTFYLYFPGKKAVFTELVRDLGHRLRSEISRSVTSLSSRREIERAGFRVFFEFTRRHPGLYRIVRQAEFVHRPAFVEYYDRLAAAYARGLEEAMRTGEIRRMDPIALAYALMGIGDMLGMRWILWEREGHVPEKVLDSILDFVFGGMGGSKRRV